MNDWRGEVANSGDDEIDCSIDIPDEADILATFVISDVASAGGGEGDWRGNLGLVLSLAGSDEAFPPRRLWKSASSFATSAGMREAATEILGVEIDPDELPAWREVGDEVIRNSTVIVECACLAQEVANHQSTRSTWRALGSKLDVSLGGGDRSRGAAKRNAGARCLELHLGRVETSSSE